MYHLCIIKYLKTSQRCLVGYKICYLGIDVRFEQNNILVHVETCVTSLCTKDVDIKQKKPNLSIWPCNYTQSFDHLHWKSCNYNVDRGYRSFIFVLSAGCQEEKKRKKIKMIIAL